jgi:fucose permease
MSWIHFFWGVGAAASPYIMSVFLTRGQPWTSGYRTIGIIQSVMAILLLLSLPVWKKSGNDGEEKKAAKLTFKQILALPGASSILVAFFCYCALETTTGLWAASYITVYKGVNPQTSAAWASLFYLGITAGRFLNGFISDKLGNRTMIGLAKVLHFLAQGCFCSL